MVWTEGGVHGVQGLGGRDENFVFYCEHTRRGNIEPHLGLEMPSLAAEARRADGGVRWGAGCEGRGHPLHATRGPLPPAGTWKPKSTLGLDHHTYLPPPHSRPQAPEDRWSPPSTAPSPPGKRQIKIPLPVSLGPSSSRGTFSLCCPGTGNERAFICLFLSPT